MTGKHFRPKGRKQDRKDEKRQNHTHIKDVTDFMQTVNEVYR